MSALDDEDGRPELDGRAVTGPLAAVAARVARLPPGVRVAIDGITAAGKSTFAAALAELVAPPVVRVTIDEFHRPGQRDYYPSSFDFPRFRAHVALLTETAIVDGVFLHHPDLRDLWDFSVFLRCDQQVAAERGIARDESWLENARERYATRYVPGEARYLAEIEPESLADMVVDTTDPERPLLVSDTVTKS